MNSIEEKCLSGSGIQTVHKLAVFSTHESGQPYANLVAFACSEDLKWLCFATIRSTRKFANLLEDARVAFLVSSSANKESDFQDAKAVTIVGSAEDVLGEEWQSALAAYLAKHPYLEDFVRSPGCTLVKVHARSYILVNNFRHVTARNVRNGYSCSATGPGIFP